MPDNVTRASDDRDVTPTKGTDDRRMEGDNTWERIGPTTHPEVFPRYRERKAPDASRIVHHPEVDRVSDSVGEKSQLRSSTPA